MITREQCLIGTEVIVDGRREGVIRGFDENDDLIIQFGSHHVLYLGDFAFKRVRLKTVKPRAMRVRFRSGMKLFVDGYPVTCVSADNEEVIVRYEQGAEARIFANNFHHIEIACIADALSTVDCPCTKCVTDEREWTEAGEVVAELQGRQQEMNMARRKKKSNASMEFTEMLEVTTVRKKRLVLTQHHIRKLLGACGAEIPEDATIYVRVPGGGDWSNADLDLDDANGLVVSWTETDTVTESETSPFEVTDAKA